MGCNCGKPKCDGKCGISPAVLQINNPSECVIFHKVDVPASMGDSTTNPPKTGAYKNVLLYYEADQTSWLYSSDGIPVRLTNGITNYEDAINLPQINGETLIGDKSSADLKLADAPMVITISSGNISWSGADTAEDIYNFFLNQGKVNVVFEGSENYGYGIVSAAYIPGEQKMMCMVAVAGVDTGSSPVEFGGNALYGLMTFYTAGKAVDVGELDLQLKLSVTDFTGLDMIDGYILEGVPATGFSIGMVKPGDGLEVASDGTLSVNTEVTHTFDTVADMKASTVLKAGDVAQTLGFHSLNDGGGAIYKITNTGTADEIAVIAIGSLYANLVFDLPLNILQLGAVGDGVVDNTAIIQKAIDSSYHVLLPVGCYKITSTLVVSKAMKIEGSLSTLYNYKGTDTPSTFLFWDGANNGTMMGFGTTTVNGAEIINLGFDGNNKSTTAVNLTRAKYTKVINCSMNRVSVGVYLSGNAYHNIVEKCYIRGITDKGVHLDYANSVHTNSCQFKDNIITLNNIGTYGLYINSGNATVIDGNMIEGYGKPIYLTGSGCRGCIITNNRIETAFDGVTPQFAIQTDGTQNRYIPSDTVIEGNAIFSQVKADGTYHDNPYYDIKDGGYGTRYDKVGNNNLIYNGGVVVNGGDWTGWATNSAHITFGEDSTAKVTITVSGETAKYPPVYQFQNAKPFRGKQLAFAAKFKVTDITTIPNMEVQCYKGGSQTIGDKGTFLNGLYNSQKIYAANEWYIQTGNIYVPEDADDFYFDVNFNSTGANTPADTVMTLDFIYLGDRLVTDYNKFSDRVLNT